MHEDKSSSLKCGRRGCAELAYYLCGTAQFPCCRAHAEEWLSQFKTERKKEYAIRYFVKL